MASPAPVTPAAARSLVPIAHASRERNGPVARDQHVWCLVCDDSGDACGMFDTRPSGP